MDLVSVTHDAVLAVIQGQIGTGHHIAALCRPSPTEQRTHSQPQFLEPERLGEVVISTRFEPGPQVFDLRPGREEQHR